MPRIDRKPHKSTDAPDCDWHAAIILDSGEHMLLQISSRVTDQSTAEAIVALTAAAPALLAALENAAAACQWAVQYAETPQDAELWRLRAKEACAAIEAAKAKGG